MTFEEILDQAIAMLQRRGRLTYGTLKRQFQLDDAALEDLKNELIEGQRLAVDERGNVLVWTGARGSIPFPIGAPAPAPHPAREDTTALWASTPLHGPSRTHASPILAGERRQVTILFADISGFTALAETLDPEDVRQGMNACFAQLVPIVEAHGGTIDKFIGDAIMGLFGAPTAYENDAERAVHTALAMLEALAALNAEQGTTLGLHWGINTGLVIAGGIGTSTHQEYSVMGDAVNLAARLDDAAERGQIFVGPETYHLTRTLFRYAPLVPMVIKGKTDPVQVYQVLGMCEAPDRRVPAAPAPLPLVGRTAELSLLLDRWENATQSLGQVVVLSGEAGIGKSRLVALDLRLALASPLTALGAYGRWLALLGAVNVLVDITAYGPLPPRPWHALYRGRQGRAGPLRAVHRHRVVPHHGDDLLAAPGGGGAGAGGKPVMDDDAILAGVLALLQYETSEQF
jgi:class 3 adenylate cyclase